MYRQNLTSVDILTIKLKLQETKNCTMENVNLFFAIIRAQLQAMIFEANLNIFKKSD